MTVKELRAFLAQFPDDAEVYSYDVNQMDVGKYVEVVKGGNLYDHLATGVDDGEYTQEEVSEWIEALFQVDIHISKNTPVIVIR